MKLASHLFAFTAVSCLVVAFASCSSAPKKTAEDTTAAANTSADDNTLGDSDSGKAMGLQTIHFAYDNFTLDDEAKGILKANSQIMKTKGSLKVQIEGHCDQRGGIQYNIALGEKRANSVKKYLHDLGIANDRISTISYGKERPVDNGTSDEAMAKNRRANFVITSR